MRLDSKKEEKKKGDTNNYKNITKLTIPTKSLDSPYSSSLRTTKRRHPLIE
jgi:hypothetical protein